MKIRFHKYQALENDFLIIDPNEGMESVPHPLGWEFAGALTRRICDRHRGIGADGVIFFQRENQTLRMRIFNADGSEAEISGNGLRILAQHIHEQGFVSEKSFVIHSVKAENRVTMVSSTDRSAISQISLGLPRFELPVIPMKGKQKFFINQPFVTNSGKLVGTAVNVGNPHLVFFVDNFDFDWRAFGREAESDRRFPEKTNVEFAIIKSRKKVVHCSWERGVGETRASGTGAASTVAAGVMMGLLDRKVTVAELAGELEIEMSTPQNEILLTGPSEKIGEGTYFDFGNEEDT